MKKVNSPSPIRTEARLTKTAAPTNKLNNNTNIPKQTTTKPA